MDKCIRQISEENEKMILSPNATLSSQSRGRLREEPECDIRTAFQRDRDRIIHSQSFRRLKHKTQVFLAPSGDHYRTRLTHTLEVSQIARTIARALQLNEDLTEAIALGHDLGHTPFGHAGERALAKLSPNGFKHYEQSVRVVDILEKDGKGLNLTDEVRNGILCHTVGEDAYTLEGQIIRIADKIAYINHDIDDAIRAGVMNEEDIPLDIRMDLGMTKSERINNMVLNVIENSNDKKILMSDDFWELFNDLHDFMFVAVYKNPVCKGEEVKAVAMLEQIYAHYINHPEEMPEQYVGIAENEGTDRAVCDYIAGMSDNYSVKIFNQLYVPKFWIE
ncbi:deoxyguanosinetriphosphate triphosphohydrolase [uncultured Eubacterium sp.]|uniref:deoxyguanosinetriphosphate triphosphohydrolase n=1 Tax=uncultured Eubacterium sp. TaxID=165185 RepID=UPI0025FAD6D8|nr:deoxyguanosinetriphosphate triphosphohydrolase [uncultured Eubacterium sp.]